MVLSIIYWSLFEKSFKVDRYVNNCNSFCMTLALLVSYLIQPLCIIKKEFQILLKSIISLHYWFIITKLFTYVLYLLACTHCWYNKSFLIHSGLNDIKHMYFCFLFINGTFHTIGHLLYFLRVTHRPISNHLGPDVTIRKVIRIYSYTSDIALVLVGWLQLSSHFVLCSVCHVIYFD